MSTNNELNLRRGRMSLVLSEGIAIIIVFKRRQNVKILSQDLMPRGSELKTVGAAMRVNHRLFYTSRQRKGKRLQNVVNETTDYE